MLNVKVGRAFRRENTSWIDPQATKGTLALAPGDDGLLHLTWKNRETDNVEDDLIIIPGDASFHRVAEAPSGRVFVLKFESSDQKHFFWVQDPSPSILEELERNVNGLLQDPDFQPTWSSSSASASTSVPAPESSSMAPAAAASGIAPVPAQPAMDSAALSQSITNQLRALIENRTSIGNQGLQMQQPSVALSDILSPNSLSPLFEPSNANVLTPLQDYLPADLPSIPSSSPEETLRRVIQSGPFQSAARQLDRAFATGLLGQLMPGFGLPEEAGLSVDLFLQAIYDKAKREHEESTRES